MKKTIVCIFIIAVSYFLSANVISEWNFETQSNVPSTGSGALSLIGGVTHDTFNGGFGGTGFGWSTTNYPAQGIGSGTGGIRIETSTLGFTDIALTWCVRHSNTSANREVLYYTLDKTALPIVWHQAAVYNANPGDIWYNWSFDGSSITGLDNNPNLAFQIVSAFANIDTTLYVASTPTSSYAASGKWRWDNISIQGVVMGPIPEHGLIINEYCSNNTAGIQNYYGEYSDWIELKNTAPDSLNLNNYCLSDNASNPVKWRFPDSTYIQPGEILLVWASNRNTQDPDGKYHTNFAISASGEPISLALCADSTIVDQSQGVSLQPDNSYGRILPGMEWYYFLIPSPGTSNTSTGYTALLSNPVATQESGWFASSVLVHFTAVEDSVQIHYTTDGSDPTEASPVWTGPQTLNNRTSAPNLYSLIAPTLPNLPEPRNELDIWTPPNMPVPKIHTLRLRSYAPGALPSHIINKTYMVGVNRYDFPVVSVTLNPADLFDPATGIYISGNSYDGNNYETANFMQNWERPCVSDWFDAQGNHIWQKQSDIEIHGNYSARAGEKSLRFKAADLSGPNSLNYPVFGPDYIDHFKHLILRNSGNDVHMTMFRDNLAQTILAEQGLDTSAYQPYIVYLNGEFWGIHILQEHVQENFIANHYNLPLADLDVLEYNSNILQGDSLSYRDLLDYLDTNDESDPSVWQYLETKIDFDNYLEYISGEIIAGNSDWPGNNNRWWRKRVPFTPGAPYGEDGRWRWVVHDMDYTFGLYQNPYWSHDTIGRALDPSITWRTQLLRNLVTNTDFRNRLINTLADRLNTNWQPAHVNSLIDQFQNRYAGTMQAQIDRWNFPTSYGLWLGEVNALHTFANGRPAFIQEKIVEHFGLTGTANITINITPPEAAEVRLNDHVNVTDGTYVYFKGVPISLIAIPDPGWVVDSFGGLGSDSLSINPDGDLTINLVLRNTSAPGLIVNEVCSNNTSILQDYYGAWSDWVEIKNSSNYTEYLDRYCLTDTPSSPAKWHFPAGATIAPGEIKLVWCNDRGTTAPNGDYQTNWKISASGEVISLVLFADSSFVDQCPSVSLDANISYGRTTPASGWFYFTQPTPRLENTTPGYTAILNDPVPTQASGWFASSINVNFSATGDSVQVRYTMDGSDPTESSPIWSGEQTLINRDSDPNIYSMIDPTLPNLPEPRSELDIWTPPNGQVPKIHVIKTRSFAPGALPSKTVTRTYMVGINLYDLPIVSVSLNPANLFDPDTGIYVSGNGYNGNNYETANFMQNWERPCVSDWFDAQGNHFWQKQSDIEIHGNFSSRAGEKSLRFKASDQAGPNSLNYPFFGQDYIDHFKHLILRNSGNDVHLTMFRDDLAQMLLSEQNLATSRYQPYQVYLNGEFWGIYNLQEHVQENYVSNHFDIPLADLDVLEYNSNVLAGDSLSYRSLLDYLNTNDEADPAVWQYLETQIDFDNYIDYISGEIYTGNSDWPGNNNRWWRKRVAYTPGAPYGSDGRWRWLVHDMDYCFGLYQNPYWSHDTIGRALDPSITWRTELLRNLVTNSDFRNRLINTLADRLNYNWQPSRVIGFINQFESKYANTMQSQIDRWNFPSSYGLWLGEVNALRIFATGRPDFLREKLVEHFALQGTANITISIEPAEAATVRFNNRVELGSGTYVYFQGVPIGLKALIPAGWELVSFGGQVSDSLYIVPGADQTIHVVLRNTAGYGLIINELCSNNTQTLQDAYGSWSDWVEIKNTSVYPLHLDNFCLTDTPSNLNKWRFPAGSMIAPGEIKLVWCNDRNGIAPNWEYQTNFKISASGEPILLVYKPENLIVDQCPSVSLDDDFSYGRILPSLSWFYFPVPTPRAENTTSGYTALLSEPSPTQNSGWFTSSVLVDFTATGDSVQVHYTTDGSEPSELSPVWTGAVTLYDCSLDLNGISMINTVLPDLPEPRNELDIWTPPTGQVPKIHTINVRSFAPGALPSQTVTRTYLVGTSLTGMPVVSLSMDPADLFDPDKGIYVAGNEYDGSSFFTANFMQNWERPVVSDWFDPSGNHVYQKTSDIEVHGTYSSRAGQKSLRFKTTAEASDHLNYPFFGNDYLSSFRYLILRNSGNDVHMTLFRDNMVTKLLKEQNLDVPNSTPYQVFINGEYWGIHNLQERMEEYYVSEHYNIPVSQLDVLEGQQVVNNGDSLDYMAMMHFLESNDPADPAVWQYLNTKIDMQNLCEYSAGEIYAGNTEWMGENVRYWRKKVLYQPGTAYGLDGRWRWLVYDMDLSFGLYQYPYWTHDTLARAFNPDFGWRNFLLRVLIQDDRFRKEFINTLADRLNYNWQPEKVVNLIDQYQSMYAPSMPSQIDRWNLPSSMYNWQLEVNSLRLFAQNRPAFLRNQIVSQFELPGTANVILDIQPANAATVRLNNRITVGAGDYVYFQSVPIDLKVLPEMGWEIVSVNGEALDSLSIVPGAEQTVHIILRRSEPVTVSISMVAGTITLHWSRSIGAMHYLVETSVQAYPDNWETLTSTTLESYSFVPDAEYRFYRIKAVY